MLNIVRKKEKGLLSMNPSMKEIKSSIKTNFILSPLAQFFSHIGYSFGNNKNKYVGNSDERLEVGKFI